MLNEGIGYKQDDSIEEKHEYIYSQESRKTEELSYSNLGQLVSRTTFREDGNIASVEYYDENGKIKPKQTHRYEYTKKDNVLEQTYYPPEPASGGGMIVLSASADSQKSSTASVSAAFRTLFVYDKAGHLREKSRFLPNGSLLEKEVFDEHEVLRRSEWRLEDVTATISIFDEQGKEIESHTTAKKGLDSPRVVDDRTLFSYDAHGNVTSMVTRGSDGSLIQEVTNEFEYDGKGNWVKKTETVLNNRWQSEPVPTAFETIREYRRVINYFPEE